jgi:hypothetical protein
MIGERRRSIHHISKHAKAVSYKQESTTRRSTADKTTQPQRHLANRWSGTTTQRRLLSVRNRSGHSTETDTHSTITVLASSSYMINVHWPKLSITHKCNLFNNTSLNIALHFILKGTQIESQNCKLSITSCP